MSSILNNVSDKNMYKKNIKCGYIDIMRVSSKMAIILVFEIKYVVYRVFHDKRTISFISILKRFICIT